MTIPMFRQGGAGLARAAESRFTLSQISVLMGLLGLAFIGITAGFLGWNERRVLFKEGREHAEQEAYFLAEHAQRLFEVSDIALRATAVATAGKDWDTIGASQELAANMRELSDLLPYVDVLLLADQAGRVRLTTLDHAPADYTVADRAVFKDAARASGEATLIGDPIVGRVSGKRTFLVVRRLQDAGGGFRGVVAVSMSLDYFTQFWARLDKRNDERVMIVRGESGSVLASFPEAAQPDGDQAIGAGVRAGAAYGRAAGPIAPTADMSGTFHRIGDLPAYVAVTYRNAALIDQWWAGMLTVVPFFLAAVAALLAMLVMGRRLAQRETGNRREVEAARALLAASHARLEQRVRERTAELQDSNEEIQRFAYIVSHDLRAPLVNIMGFTAELGGLRGQLFAPEPAAAAAPAVREDFDEALGFIHSSIDKMDRLIKAILTLSRQGQRKLRPETLDMDGLMRSVADGVAHRTMQAGAVVEIGPLPPLVADRVAVEQIFSNLVDNAVKYLEPGRPGRITITGTASATTVTYTVRDNGRGIDPKDHERVFELFRRAGRQDQPGEGIGLANVRSLVRRLQGAVTLDSAAGPGCAFTVTLPKFGTEDEVKGRA